MLYDPKWEKPPLIAREPWRDLLFAAAAKIERRGWCKGQLMNCTGALCIMGALHEAANNVELLGDTVMCLRRFLKTDSIPDWNDAGFRTKQEIVDTLRACAAQR